MTQDLDHLLGRLAQIDGATANGLEAAVLARIAEQRAAQRESRALAPARAASVAAALLVGAVAGGLIARGAPPGGAAALDTFSASARLAPSTLLAG